MPRGADRIPRGTPPAAAYKMGLDPQKKLLARCQGPLMRTDRPAWIDAASRTVAPRPSSPLLFSSGECISVAEPRIKVHFA